MKALAFLTVLVTVLLAAAPAAAFADHIPVPPDGVVELQGRTQLVATIDNVDLMAEVLARQEYVDPVAQSFDSLTAGVYYRLLANLKVGAFYRLQAGAHHDDDWVPNTQSPPGWEWQVTSGRLESLLMLDVSPRFLLDFLPGRDWVFMLKGRYIFNTFNGEQSILARPELTWFWIVDRVPVLNVSLAYEMYFPLNFGTPPLYESYPYLTLLWHATPDLGVELAGSYRTTVWSPSRDVVASGQPIAGAFPIAFTSWVISLGAVITLAF